LTYYLIINPRSTEREITRKNWGKTGRDKGC